MKLGDASEKSAKNAPQKAENSQGESEDKMQRKLVDVLDALVDAGLIMTKEESVIYIGPTRIAYDFRRMDIEQVRQNIAMKLADFFALANKLALPTHNAVAFFTKLIELEQSTNKPPKEELCEILHLALSGRGFVFGTTFDLERSPYLRPSDLCAKSGVVDAIGEGWGDESEKDIKDNFEYYVERRIDEILLKNHAQLKSGLLFLEDYHIIDQEIQELARQAQVVADWQKEIEAAQDTQPDEPRFKKDDLKAFLSIFEWYSLEQLKVSSKAPDEDDFDVKRITEELRKIKTASELLYDLNYHVCELERLLKIEDKDERIKAKQAWLRGFFEFLKSGDTVSVIETVESLDENHNTQQFLGLKAFISAAKRNIKLENMTMLFPGLQSGDTKLTDTEIKMLTNYRQHPMYRSYKAVIKGLSDKRNINIAPYFLTEWFIHRLKPLGPFLKQQNNVDISINDQITIEKDLRVHHYQNCNYWFFCKLCGWYASVEGASYNDELCHALYARCRHQVVKKDWVLIESRDLKNRRSSEEPIFKLYQQLDGIFDYEAFPFPLYAKTLNHAESVLYHFYDRQDDKLRKVQRTIKNVVTEDDVKRYRELVFCSDSDDGIGKSVLPLAWHKNLAKWLESIIRRDKVISSFVVGKEDPDYPGTAIPLSEIQNAITFYNDKDNIYPEDLQPYLAFVQWYIHKVCCEKIRDDMQQKVIKLCKRVFLD